ncbi:MAG: thiamine biosynthesis lipoprotein [Candidatus Marinamargulisbacteria bacterium]
MKYFSVRWLGLIVGVACLFVWAGVATRQIKINDSTMGTTYHITARVRVWQTKSGLKKRIQRRLVRISKSMSTYDSESEISLFNRMGGTDFVVVSNSFYTVLSEANRLFHQTDGALDVSIKPVLDAWGLYDFEKRFEVPKKREVELALSRVGFGGLAYWPPNQIKKPFREFSVDVSSVAKGYAVDELADICRQLNIDNFLIEIGGDLFASGNGSKGRPWRVGINVPDERLALDSVHKVVRLIDLAMATSGDYRRFHKHKGKRYSHIIDPKTGFPVKNGVASVSVISENCMSADGLATAIMVMGVKKGMILLNEMENTEGAIIIRSSKGKFRTLYSAGFEKFLASNF